MEGLILGDAKTNGPADANVWAFAWQGRWARKLLGCQPKRKVPLTRVGVTSCPLIVALAFLFCRIWICDAC